MNLSVSLCSSILPRGAWYLTKPLGTASRPRPVCIEYTAPYPDGVYVCTLPSNHYFGPVHAAVCSSGFLAVHVPSHQDPTALVWVNVKSGDATYAVDATGEAALWIRLGWVNWFLK